MVCKNLFDHEAPVPVRPLVWIGIRGVVVRPNLKRMLHYYSLNVADVLRTSWKPVETLRSHWGFRCPCEAPRHKRPFRFLEAIIKIKHPHGYGELLKYVKKSLTDARSWNTSESALFSVGEFRNVWSRPRSWSEKSDPPSKSSLRTNWALNQEHRHLSLRRSSITPHLLLSMLGHPL